MDIDFFSEFLTLADTQVFSTTAERHYVSIATLVRHMCSLENQLGTVLFHRYGKKAFLTDAGKALIPYAQTIVGAREGYCEAVASIRNRPNLNINVASNIPLSFYGMTDLIEKFQREHNIDRINAHPASFQQIEDGLLNEKYDFAIVCHLENLPCNLAAIPLKKIEVATLMPATHRLAEKSSVQISDLKGEPLLLLDSISPFYNHAIRLCREAGFEPIIRATAHSGRSVEDLVSGGFGIGLMPVDTSPNFSESVVRKPISPRCEVTLDIVCNSTEPSKNAGALMQYLGSAFSGSRDAVRTRKGNL